VNDAISVTMSDTLPVLINLSGNDTDSDNDPLVITSVAAGPFTASVTLDGKGNVVYLPIGLIGETDVLAYTISDGFGGADSWRLTVTLERSNVAPLAHDDSIRVKANVLMRLFPTANDIDSDEDPLTISG
jgi:hypothetical protein